MEPLESSLVSTDFGTAPRSGHGGAREGAGRPPGIIEERPRLHIPKDVKRCLKAEYEAQVLKSRTGSQRVMRAFWRAIDAGDSKILKDTLDRVLGRPVTAIELSGPGGGPLRVQAASFVALSLATPEQLDALAAFSRLVIPPEDDPDDLAGELVEGEPGDPVLEAPRDIIVCPVEPEPPQVIDRPAVDPLGTDIADWLAEG